MEENEKEIHPLRLLREERGLTRPQVKQLIGISERRQADWESGKALPSIENVLALSRLYSLPLKKMCEFLGLDVKDIPDDVSHP